MKKPEFDWDAIFDEYLETLTEKENVKLVARIKIIEEYGLQIAMRSRWVDKLDENLYEIRERTSDKFLRGIYFQVKDNKYWITHGFNKKTNKTPKIEIRKAKILRRQYQENLERRNRNDQD